MNKIILIIVLLSISVFVFANFYKKERGGDMPVPAQETGKQIVDVDEKTDANMPNPASVYCEENGGILEMVENTDGSQFGLCKLEDYSCEEWAYFRGECDIEKDTQGIKEALLDKGLNLTGMKVVIFKHLGKYIEAGVVPVDMLGGGGYVFAVKDGEDIKIVADGNGAIMCEMLIDYPDYPAYLIPECISEDGIPIAR